MMEFGHPPRHFAQCASTNDLARLWIADAIDPAPHGAIVTADFQTAGRGQRGKSWSAAFGQSALMSYILRPQNRLSQAGELAFVAAIAVIDALSTLGLEGHIKWPNDILLNNHKVAGILVETVQSNPWAAIVGIGVNVNQERFWESEQFAFPPTSLRLETGRSQSVEAFIGSVAHALGTWDAVYRAQGFPPILAACREHLAVGMTLSRGGQSAVFRGLNGDGGALVELPGGTFQEWKTVE